ncbi:MAG TPA: tetratricopeptide repeat protein [Streptosporangiaceae bacterium]|nr:tetratricopeptide repeat protein [Streptosporangiaceae bacterium]
MVVLTRDLFDAIEFDAACSGDHRAAAEQMSDLAAAGTQTADLPRSEAYLRAGEQWLLADDPAAAARRFRRALEDGGPAFVDPRVPLARALYMMDKPAEGDALVRQLESEQPQDPRMCDLVAELLVERSDLEGALRWATRGVELCVGQAPGGGPEPSSARNSPPLVSDVAGPQGLAGAADQNELRLLLSLRYRIRNDLGMPEDGYDRLLDELPSASAGDG